MVDVQTTVCCMCGDVGFSDKLFRCSKCSNRFQHSYCSNYYGEVPEPIQQCDWCQSEERSSSSRQEKLIIRHDSTMKPQQSSYDKIKQQPVDGNEPGSTAEKGKSQSPRTTTRRYKLLKDVMC